MYSLVDALVPSSPLLNIILIKHNYYLTHNVQMHLRLKWAWGYSALHMAARRELSQFNQRQLVWDANYANNAMGRVGGYMISDISHVRLSSLTSYKDWLYA